MAIDKGNVKQHTESGKEQQNTIDNYEQRAEKLVGILEAMASEPEP